MEGYEGFFKQMDLVVNFDIFLQYLIYLRFGWRNLDEIGDQIEEFLML